jgi:hypothetical protein
VVVVNASLVKILFLKLSSVKFLVVQSLFVKLLFVEIFVKLLFVVVFWSWYCL